MTEIQFLKTLRHLVGDGSYADTKTVVVGRGKQKQNFTTKVVHWGKIRRLNFKTRCYER